MGDCDEVWIDDEFMDVPKYLVITGGICLGINVLTIFCMGNDRGRMVMVGLVILARVSFFFYGSYLVFGTYGIWTYGTKVNDDMYYCAYTPFMFAFVHLIIWWIVIALGCVIAGCCFCGCCSKPKTELPSNNVVSTRYF